MRYYMRGKIKLDNFLRKAHLLIEQFMENLIDVITGACFACHTTLKAFSLSISIFLLKA